MLETSRPRERLPGLDILRGLAAVSVLAFHFTTQFGFNFGHPATPWILVPWGQRGVHVFFVISGFAIQLSLESTNSAREFLLSRFIRLYPTFWAAVVLTFTVVEVFGLPLPKASPLEAIVNLSMIPESLGARGVDGVYWTLERELRFYGLVSLMLALGLRRYTVHTLLVSVAVLAVDSTFHVIPHWLADLLNVEYAHLFASGAVLAYFRHVAWWKTAGLLALCLGASGPKVAVSFADSAYVVALVWLATRPFMNVRVRPLLFLGSISYPLYLVHQHIGYVVMRAVYARGAPFGVAVASACAVALASATALHFVVEKPCLSLVRRIRQKPTASPRGRRHFRRDRARALPWARAKLGPWPIPSEPPSRVSSACPAREARFWTVEVTGLVSEGQLLSVSRGRRFASRHDDLVTVGGGRRDERPGGAGF